MSTNILKITNAKIVTINDIIYGSVIIKSGIITEIIPFQNNEYFNQNAPYIETIDLNGHYLLPGFVDIHCHGGNGSSFMDCTIEDFENVLSYHYHQGTTTIFPTSLSCNDQLLFSFLDTYKLYYEKKETYKNMLGGVHLEGPYLSTENAGAQPINWCTIPDLTFAQSIINTYPFIKRWTIAPEKDQNYKLASILLRKKILVSAGHTNALYEDMCDAFCNGYKHMTHLYSGMNTMVYIDGLRKAGAVEASLLNSEISVELIADGIHLPYPFIEIVYKMKGASKIAIITDSMRGTGTTSHNSILGNRITGTHVILEDGVAKLPNHSSLAGSITPLIDMFRGLVKNTKIPFVDIVRMCSDTPAHIMNIHHSVGAIKKNNIANLVELDDNLNIIAIISNGIYNNSIA